MKNKNFSFHIPSPRATVFEFEVNRKDDQRCTIKVVRDEAFFYRLENGDNRRVLIGGYCDLMNYLFKTGARWLLRRKNKEITLRMFFEKSDAIFLLKEGYSLFHVPSSTIMSYDKDYSTIIVSNNGFRNIGDIPGGYYSVAWLEGRNPMTLDQVETERQRAKEEKEKAAARETAKIKREQMYQLQQENRKPQPAPTVVEPSRLVEKIKLIGTGSALGIALTILFQKVLKRYSTNHYMRTAELYN